MIDIIACGELEVQECPVTQRFTSCIYLRYIFMLKGTRIKGKLHSIQPFKFILVCTCTFITAEGVEEMKAPHTFISKAGVKKVVVAHVDCQWQTLHVTDSTDLEEIEKVVICKD